MFDDHRTYDTICQYYTSVAGMNVNNIIICKVGSVDSEYEDENYEE